MVVKSNLNERLRRHSWLRIFSSTFSIFTIMILSWISGGYSISLLVFGLMSVALVCGLELFLSLRTRNAISSFQDLTLELRNNGRRLAGLVSSIDKVARSLLGSFDHSFKSIAKIDGSIAAMDTLVTENIEKFRSLTQTVSNRTSDAYSTMNQLTGAMEALGQTNVQLQDISGVIQKITSETNVINDIVFKTQLLSFNAFLEAARAGQHGTGFAVVAEEVGNLAQSSGDAAKEIRGLLVDSQTSVDAILKNTRTRITDGKATSEQTLNIFSEIVNHFDDQLKEIIELGRSQKSSVREIETMLTSMRAASGEASSLSDEFRDLAESLRGESQALGSVSRSFSMLLETAGTSGIEQESDYPQSQGINMDRAQQSETPSDLEAA